MRNEIRYEVDNRIVHIDHFDDNDTLAEQGIAGASFEDLISEAEEAFTEQHTLQKAPEKKPLAAGDTVYLEKTTTPLRWRKSASLMCICATRISR